jgi:hypothetical protein
MGTKVIASQPSSGRLHSCNPLLAESGKGWKSKKSLPAITWNCPAYALDRASHGRGTTRQAARFHDAIHRFFEFVLRGFPALIDEDFFREET